MSQQKPTVGRIVHYVAYGSPGGEFPAGACRAAIITQVKTFPLESGDVVEVGLCVLNPTGQYFNLGVPYADAADDIKTHGGENVEQANTPGTWHWPERS